MPRTQQASFSSLSILDWTDADPTYNVPQQAPSACDGLKNHGNKTFVEEEPSPINFVDDEAVFAMVAGWDACPRTRSVESWDASHKMEGSASKSVNLEAYDPIRRVQKSDFARFDPVRRLKQLAPPKLFTRSPERKIILRSVQNQMDEVAEETKLTNQCETA